jgi:hypothetical protein
VTVEAGAVTVEADAVTVDAGAVTVDAGAVLAEAVFVTVEAGAVIVEADAVTTHQLVSVATLGACIGHTGNSRSGGCDFENVLAWEAPDLNSWEITHQSSPSH